MIFSAVLISIWVLFMPTVSAIDCIQCRVRLENEKIVNGDPTGGCLLQPGRDNHIIWSIACQKTLCQRVFGPFWNPKKGSSTKCDEEFDRCYVRYEYGEKMTGGGENATTVCKSSIFVCQSCLKMNWFSFEGCDSRLRKLKLVQKDVLQRWTVA